MKKPKMKSEAQMRRDILYNAKLLGCDGEVIKIFERYDNLLRSCTNEQERYQIQVMGAAEIHVLLQCKKALIVNGNVIIPQDPDYKEPKDDI